MRADKKGARVRADTGKGVMVRASLRHNAVPDSSKGDGEGKGKGNGNGKSNSKSTAKTNTRI